MYRGPCINRLQLRPRPVCVRYLLFLVPLCIVPRVVPSYYKSQSMLFFAHKHVIKHVHGRLSSSQVANIIDRYLRIFYSFSLRGQGAHEDRLYTFSHFNCAIKFIYLFLCIY